MFARHFTALIIAFCLSVSIAGQTYTFKNIGTGKGFEDGASYHLLQDSRGYIWMSTNGQLLRYNGKNITGYNVFNAIYRAWEDETGRLFYLPADGKPGILQGDKGFVPPMSDTLSKLLNAGRFFINDMGSFDKDNFLFSTQRGFYITDKNKLKSVTLIAGPDSVSFWIKIINGKAYGAFYPVPVKKTANGNEYKVGITIGNKNHVIPVELETGSPGPSVFKCVRLNDGRVLAGFYNKILVINPNGSWYYHKLQKRLTCLYQDRNNGLWVGHYKGGAEHYKNADLRETPVYLLPELSVSSVLHDNEGGFWLSTLEENVFYCPNIKMVNFSNVPIVGRNIRSLNSFHEKILCGTYDNRLFIIKNKSIEKVFDFSSALEHPGGFRYFIHRDKINISGIKPSYDLDSSFRRLKLVTPGAQPVSIYNFAENKNKDLFGVSFGDAWKIRNDSLIKLFPLPARAKDICSDTSGQIYLGTLGGLFLLNEKGLSAVRSVTASVLRMRCFNQNNIWVVTEADGVYQIKDSTVLRHYSVKEGIPAGACNDIETDDKGNKWIGTNNGLFYIGPNNKAIIYDTHYGLPDNAIPKLNLVNRDLFIATAKGLCVADLNSLKINSAPPRVYIDSIYTNGLRSDLTRFDHTHNNFVFYIDGLSYFNPEGIKFRYRLAALDTTWRTNSTGEISFTNLDHGQYVFEIYAISASGINSATATFGFTITPPFWKRWWFILLVVCATLTTIWLLFRWRVGIIKKREEEKTSINKIIAEYQMDAIRAQMNPHFIFNAINSIQHYILSNETQYAYDYLAKFSKLIRQVLVNSERKEINLKDEVDLLKLYMDLEKRRFKDRFDYTINYTDTLDDIKVPAMLIQPFVENAIWHGFMGLEDTVKGKVKIDFELNNDTLLISVEDNGIGREESRRRNQGNNHVSLGMRFAQKRVDLFKTINKKDARLEITDLKDPAGKVRGTRVEIFITVRN